MTDREAATAEAGGVVARYYETDTERILAFERVGTAEPARDGGGGAAGRTAAVAQNVEGYAMLKVRESADGDELERYYGFEMALDHAAELLDVPPRDLPVPDPAGDMGM